jgi:hypothetical protein
LLSLAAPQHPRKPTTITTEPVANITLADVLYPLFPRNASYDPGDAFVHIPIAKMIAPVA